jgi:multidrug efflux system membrane fusion protein
VRALPPTKSAAGPRLRVVRAWLAAALPLLLVACAGETAPESTARPVLVTRPGTAGEALSAYAGEIRAREESTLAFRVGGKLVERKVDIGDRVEQGQLLATLDPGDLQAQARAAQAQLSAAQAQLERARADQARFAALAEQQLVSQSALDAQNAAATAAQGQVDAARAQLQVARNQAAYSELRAPADGVIAARHAEAGQVVAAGQPVFTLAADGVREVAFAVPEGEVDRIEPGQAIAVELWSEPGKRWPGVVREVAPAADPASRTYAVRAGVEAPAGALDLGQSAEVFIDAGDGQRLSVPLAALQRLGEHGTAVFVVDPETSTLKLQPVEVGDYGNDRVPVTRGLEPGAWVVAAGGHLLREGQKVRAVDRNNRPVLD